MAVTRRAAGGVATVFRSLLDRHEGRESAQRFILQCVVAMFSEDIGLLPRGLFTELVHDVRAGVSAYDLIGALFRQMNAPSPAKGGRFQKVPYFNGGLFEIPATVDLTGDEIELIASACAEDWSKVEPAIFGTLFQGCMEADERHAYGAHFTSEAEIQRVVLPTIVRPWRERIAAANTLKRLLEVYGELLRFRVIDPACGSGNFLYVAYRELKRLETDILTRIHTEFSGKKAQMAGAHRRVGIMQCFGIDSLRFAVELAKVTLIIAKKIAADDSRNVIESRQMSLDLEFERTLPLDNLDQNIICADALFAQWQPADAVIGNPPFQSKNKMQKEFGAKYVRSLRARFPTVPKRADYCAYWFRLAHDFLAAGGQAGLVATNTIRQNYSREASLDYIIGSGGTIIEAVSSQVWPGEAGVDVSIVNWVKGPSPGMKKLYTQLGDDRTSPWRVVELQRINSALSENADVAAARPIMANRTPKRCFQGQTHGHEGFLMPKAEALNLLKARPKYQEVLFPYLIGDDLLATNPSPTRYVIDFQSKTLVDAAKFVEPFQRVKQFVLPDRQEAANEELNRNIDVKNDGGPAPNKHHQNFLNRWWRLSWSREGLIRRLSEISRYLTCSRVTKRPVFEFVDPTIHPGDALTVFALEDDYSFGILQSDTHWSFFTARCSTLTSTPRYTSETVFDCFPWPQEPTSAAIRRVAEAGRELRKVRWATMHQASIGFRELYRILELPGTHPVKTAHAALNASVRDAYGMSGDEDALAFLLDLNLELVATETGGGAVTGPGLPPTALTVGLVTSDRIKP